MNMRISLKDIKEKIENIEILNYNQDISFSKFGHDTRELEQDSLYIPIVGENFDGHQYIKEALSNGSTISLCEKSKKNFIKNISSPVILTNNVLDTLGKILNLYLKNIRKEAKIIAIIGSTGKTTTREMISSVLGEDGKVLHSGQNFNTLWGNAEVLDDYTDEKYIVLEFGIDKEGEMEGLCKSINPGYGVFLNVGNVHAEALGSVENIFKEKRKLADYLNEENGFLALNIDDERLKGVKDNFNGNLMTFGRDMQSDVKILNRSLSLGGTNVRIAYDNSEFDIHLKVLGKGYAYNACAAFCIGIEMGLSIENIRNGLKKYNGFGGRFQTVEVDKNISIINDAYNANPTSMSMSIETFNELYKGKDVEKVLILGDMRELGQYTEEEHRKIAKLIKDLGYNEEKVFFLGKNFKHFKYGSEIDSPEEVVEIIRRYQRKKIKAIFLLKGSHGTELYKVPDLLTPSNISS